MTRAILIAIVDRIGPDMTGYAGDVLGRQGGAAIVRELLEAGAWP